MRSRALRLAAVGLGAVVLAAAALALEILWSAGQFRTLEPHFDGSCVAVGGLDGPEDLTIHPRTGVAYVSAVDRRAALAGQPTAGSILAYDLTSAEPALRDLTPNADARFLPHGLSLHVAPDGRDRLFVIDHRPREDGGVEHRVLVYDVSADGLALVRTLRDPLLGSPNDLVAVGPDRFYVTNDHGSEPGTLARALEDYLRLPWGGVVYYDGTGFREVADGIAYANGINASPDGRTLYVASVSTGRLHVFDRDPATGALAERDVIDLGSGGDNIEVDADGVLWIGAHPKLLDFVAHAGDASKRAPSQVLRVDPRSGAVEEVYLDLGDALSASSVAAVRGPHLLVGAVFDDHFLHCRRGGDRAEEERP